MVLLNLQKAFDTVDLSILLLEKLAIDWFHSYLQKQMVEMSGIPSKLATTTCGMPQRSILGSLLFHQASDVKHLCMQTILPLQCRALVPGLFRIHFSQCLSQSGNGWLTTSFHSIQGNGAHTFQFQTETPQIMINILVPNLTNHCQETAWLNMLSVSQMPGSNFSVARSRMSN